MKPDYKNWVPKGMIYGLAAGTAVLVCGLYAVLDVFQNRVCLQSDPSVTA